MNQNQPPALSLHETSCIEIKGAREHNLKDVTLSVPKRRLVVFTGVSGSGKSSLAFDTLFAEGQRRYVESLSAYARQFLGQLDKPHYDTLRGLSPTISIEQKAQSKNPRSTVGTITEITDYLRVLYARVGVQHCCRCGEPVTPVSSEEIVNALERLEPGVKFQLFAPLVENRKGEYRDLLRDLRASGFTRIRLNGEIVSLDEEITLDKKRKYKMELLVDRLIAKPDQRRRLSDSVETALRHGGGNLYVQVEGEPKERFYSEHRQCLNCDLGYPELSPQSFSFNSPQGCCPVCNGLGVSYEVDIEKVIPDPALSIEGGAYKPWKDMAGQPVLMWYRKILRTACKNLGIDLEMPWQDLSEEARSFILYGAQGQAITLRMRGHKFTAEWEGLLPQLLRRWRESENEDLQEKLGSYLLEAPCPACRGQRLRPESAAVRIDGISLPDLCDRTIPEVRQRLEGFLQHAGSMRVVVEELLKETQSRLRFLEDVGLEYLSLSRPGPSLSGGESQRIRLASQLGSELTGVIYILDEPSIGLHPRDNTRLIHALQGLRDLGNSVIVVEHDAEMMMQSDWIVDFGPGAGLNGGQVVAEGTPEEILLNPKSLTGAYLSGREKIEIPRQRRPNNPEKQLRVVGATANNLKQLDVSIPVGLFTCVTGVSGAGKSTLVNQILLPAATAALNHARQRSSHCEGIRGLEHFDHVINIDQAPIGRTPRSNPATYTKVWDDIRALFAQVKEAKAFGYAPGRFSFNIKGGRCEHCQGAGVTRVEMHFLADVYVPCEVCGGRRFNDATLRVLYKEKSIADMLDMSVDEAADLLSVHPKIVKTLKTLQDVGLGYIKLGQSSTTLSGGEAQRIKLSRELAKRSTGRTLYILDEPSTGLHFDDIRKLLYVIQRLVDAGNTVLMIEHNLDIIKTADWVIDMGPEGGSKGGRIIAEGTPEDLTRVAESYTGQYLKETLAHK